MNNYIVAGFPENLAGMLCVISGQENFRSPFSGSKIIIIEELSFKIMDDKLYEKVFMKGSGVVVARELKPEEKQKFYLGFETEDEFFQRVVLDTMTIKEVVREEMPLDIFLKKPNNTGKNSRGAYFNSQKKIKPGKIVKRRR